MKLFQLITVIMLFSWQSAISEEFSAHIGTWELHKIERTNRAGQEYPAHRLVLTEDGRYLNSATKGGPIAVNYKLQKDDDNHGWYSFLIETPDDHQFGRAAGLRVDKRGLVMEYFDGRILTYTRISQTADLQLLVSPKGESITIQANKKKHNKAEMATPRKPSD